MAFNAAWLPLLVPIPARVLTPPRQRRPRLTGGPRDGMISIANKQRFTEKEETMKSICVLVLCACLVLSPCAWAQATAGEGAPGSAPDVRITLDKRVAYCDEPVTATWSITGGNPPFTVWGDWQTMSNFGGGDLELDDLPTVGNYTFTPDPDGEMSGIGSLGLDIRDANGQSYFESSGSHRILSRSEPAYLTGDADGSGGLSDRDLTFIIDWLFKKGVLPSWHNADVNWDFEVNAQDLTALIDLIIE